MNERRFKSPLKLTAPHPPRVLSPESGTHCCRRTASALPSTPPWLLILWSLPSLLYIILELKEIFKNYSLNKSPMFETCKTVRLLWWKVKGPDPALLTTFYSPTWPEVTSKMKGNSKQFEIHARSQSTGGSQVPGQSIINPPCNHYPLRKTYQVTAPSTFPKSSWTTRIPGAGIHNWVLRLLSGGCDSMSLWGVRKLSLKHWSNARILASYVHWTSNLSCHHFLLSKSTRYPSTHYFSFAMSLASAYSFLYHKPNSGHPSIISNI